MKAFLKEPRLVTVSERALNMRPPIDGSFAQDGISPHRAADTARDSRLRDTRTIGTRRVGARLKLASRAPSVSSTASKSAARSVALRVDA
ncbi:hypothetical protein Afil01_09350 [Actinorhabdospora filicis]|uniref:Uncharacterized protein n=1 Tax=Actinorhabdospora filicis TaxID=1785913 RepID=A0A9W6SH19_9ACTN|nr:hypothetical protein Afil01_09350 [Actinorhabdospora filicis]